MRPALALSPLLAALALPCLADPGVVGPPPTAVEVVTDQVQGEAIADPYRWLEGDADGQVTERVAAWTDAQNAYTRGVLDAVPFRAELEARLRPLMTIGSVSAPVMRGALYFNREREGEQNQSVLYVRKGAQGERRALVDPNALDAKGLVSLDWFEPSPDGALVAFGLSRAGDELSTLHVLDTATGAWRADEIPNKAGGVGWLPASDGFVYEVLRAPKDPYSKLVKVHRLGLHPREDPTLVEQHGTTWGPFAYPSRDGRWLIVGDYTGTRSNDLWCVDLDRWRRDGSFERTPILVGADATAAGPVQGDTLFMLTTLDAPRGRVVAVDLNRPDKARWRDVVAQPERAVIEEASIARGVLVLRELEDARTVIERYALTGDHVEPLGALPLPGIGSAWISTEPDRTEAFVTYTSYNEPTSVYQVDLLTGARTLWKRPEVPVDPSLIEVEQVRFRSKDGTEVPMFLVHRKGLKMDTGDVPTHLYGYGGFGISMTPSFSATLYPWLEAGGVFAVANLRGGGEYGDAWHEAGTLGKKQAVFDDFIGAAEYLIAKKITSPARLAISGRSNGGLLVGAVLVQRPDLFRAVICGVPLLDMLRYQRFLMARFWVPEYGSSEDAAQFAFLRRYSPYHQVKAGTAYPAVLFTAGENDSRVHPLHARKMAAAIQAATTSDPAARPVLLWVDREAGHGSGKPLALRLRDVTDEQAFLMSQVGLRLVTAAR